MTVKEVADRLQVAEKTVKAWIATGHLQAVNVSLSVSSKKPRLRVLEDDLLAFQASRIVCPKASRKSPSKKLPPSGNWV